MPKRSAPALTSLADLNTPRPPDTLSVDAAGARAGSLPHAERAAEAFRRALLEIMKQNVCEFTVQTHGKGLYELTGQIESWVGDQHLQTGLLTLFCRHTSASLVVQENADPDVQADLARYFEHLVPENARDYIHTIEGPDDMPAHIRSALTGVHLSIPLIGSALALGTWQGIYLFEHRAAAHRRVVAAHLLGV